MEIEEAKIKNLRSDIAELKGFLDQAKGQKVKDILSIGLRKLETDLVDILNQAEKTNPPTTTATSTTATPATTTKHIAYDVQVKNYSWDQSENFVKIYLTGLKDVHNLPKDSIKSEFDEKSVKIRVEGLNGKNHVFSIKETSRKLNPTKCHFKIKTDMIGVFLAKSDNGVKWTYMTKAEQDFADAKEARTKEDTSSSGDPQASLMNMMKKLYEDGDDDMKRTITKAWTEAQKRDPSI